MPLLRRSVHIGDTITVNQRDSVLRRSYIHTQTRTYTWTADGRRGAARVGGEGSRGIADAVTRAPSEEAVTRGGHAARVVVRLRAAARVAGRGRRRGRCGGGGDGAAREGGGGEGGGPGEGDDGGDGGGEGVTETQRWW